MLLLPTVVIPVRVLLLQALPVSGMPALSSLLRWVVIGVRSSLGMIPFPGWLRRVTRTIPVFLLCRAPTAGRVVPT